MVYSAYKLNKQGYNIQLWCTPFPIWNQSIVSCPVLTLVSLSAYHKNMFSFLRNQQTVFQSASFCILTSNVRKFLLLCESVHRYHIRLCNHMDYCSPPGSSVHGILQAWYMNGCHALFQGIFPNQGLNPGLWHWGRFFTSWATREVQKKQENC